MTKTTESIREPLDVPKEETNTLIDKTAVTFVPIKRSMSPLQAIKLEEDKVLKINNVTADGVKDSSVSKKKVAILLGYSGTRYQSMQLNPRALTIEAVLFRALINCGLVSSLNSVDAKKVQWMRAARTDKGVSAAGQVVSLKMEMLSRDGTVLKKMIIEELAKLMPKTLGSEATSAKLETDIWVYDVLETVGSFHAKERCDSRFYRYILPTYLFKSTKLDLSRPSANGNALLQEASESEREAIEENETDVMQKGEALDLPTTAVDAACASPSSSSSFYQHFVPVEEDLKVISSYRLSSEALSFINEVLGYFKGTHSFHNYTPGKTGRDPSAQRFIRSAHLVHPFLQVDTKSDASESCSVPLFVDEHGVEWTAIEIHGNSFMLHQIRKMVGLVIWATKLLFENAKDKTTDLDASKTTIMLSELIKHTFKSDCRVNVPKAPALGLFLDRACFDGYNKKLMLDGEQKIITKKPKLGSDEQESKNINSLKAANKLTIDFDRYKEDREHVLKNLIYPTVLHEETTSRVYWRWCKAVETLYAKDLEYITEFRK